MGVVMGREGVDLIITMALPEGERVLDGVVGRRDGGEGWGGGESTPSPLPHHYTTHSPHRNDVIRKDGEVSGSHVERLVSHQLKVGSCVTKSEEGFK